MTTPSRREQLMAWERELLAWNPTAGKPLSDPPAFVGETIDQGLERHRKIDDGGKG